jgi:3-O-methylgallate 3,4-dioxygenase
MAEIVLGIATSHTPMLNAPAEDWPRFIERDQTRALLDKEGRPARYEALLERADPSIAAELAPARVAARHREAQQAVDHLRAALRRAELDALVIVGDDHRELYDDGNLPSLLVYRGETIRNQPLASFAGPDWARRASARYYEESEPRDYPVEARLATHLIETLIEEEFDPASSDRLPEGQSEGHAFGFVRKRMMTDQSLPVVPVLINTYFPPNQPTPRRCYRLGRAIRKAVESYPGRARIGIVGSGGLSHFVVDEGLDRAVIGALAAKDRKALENLPREKLNSGSSEIRNWICAGGASEHLDLVWSSYVPGYRTPAGTGTGLGFALFS